MKLFQATREFLSYPTLPRVVVGVVVFLRTSSTKELKGRQSREIWSTLHV
ncbi:MAG: hypothetical protein HXS41_10700 [Theionarchaea archaeon]|nr:hypothetical protein [Theionarchaea archaeon]MBU7021515.1 hypothetical protein [Theionarchaea archaeon]